MSSLHSIMYSFTFFRKISAYQLGLPLYHTEEAGHAFNVITTHAYSLAVNNDC